MAEWSPLSEEGEENQSITVVRANPIARKTAKSHKRAAGIFRSYLESKAWTSDFENFDKSHLNECLSHFFMDIRKADGETYKLTSLENLRHSLNRYLQYPPHNKPFDIIKDVEFQGSNEKYRVITKQLKQEGKGSVDHYPVISDSDFNKIYNSACLKTSTPQGLLNKVQMDIRLYFFRRGFARLHDMTKSTFTVKRDPNTGMKFVCKAFDDRTKNGRETEDENVGGYMPEMPGSSMCPVLSFEKYINKLNDQCDKLWQRPKGTNRYSVYDEDSGWYCNVPIGEKALARFMSKLSGKCGLSQTYSNHSIRSTGALLMSIHHRNSGRVQQIMTTRGTGHLGGGGFRPI